MYFLHIGILFLSFENRLYMPFSSLQSIAVTRHSDPSSSASCAEAQMTVTEPFYEKNKSLDDGPCNGPDTEKSILLHFTKIPLYMDIAIERFAEMHGLGKLPCE